MRDLIQTAPRMDVSVQDIEHVVEAWHADHAIYRPLLPRRAQREAAPTERQGWRAPLPRKSIEPMVLAVDGVAPTAVRAMQACIRAGPWPDERWLHQHWHAVETDLGADAGVLLGDGSDVPKQGVQAGGVKRQDGGELGQRANGQAGVWVGSVRSQGDTVRDRRLYVPGEWLTDAAYAARRRQCGLPPDLPVHTKPVVAPELLAAVVQSAALRCRWVVADEACGGNPAVRDGVAGLGRWYCYRRGPHHPGRGRASRYPPAARAGAPPPPAAGTSGRGCTRGHTGLGRAAAVPAAAWTRQTLTAGSQGPRVAEFATLRVVAGRDTWPGPDVWLVRRRHVETGELQTYLRHAPIDTAWETHVRMSGMRGPLDTCVEDSQQRLGLGAYAIRGGTGWHHPLTLVSRAHFVVVRLSLRFKKRPSGDAAPGGAGVGGSLTQT